MSLEGDFLFESGIGSFEAEAAGPGRINILVVDDSADYLMALEQVLSGPDRQLMMVQTGEEALRYLLTADVGVILLDVGLAGLNGYETAALIRQRSRTRFVPIIFVTGFSKDDSDIARGYSFGAVDYIFKPVDPAVLRSKVDCFVELAKLNHGLKRQTLALGIGERQHVRSAAAAVVIQLPEPAFLTDADGLVLHANQAAADLLGLITDKPITSGTGSFLLPAERWMLGGAIREAAERLVVRELILHPRLPGGGMSAVQLRVGPLKEENGQLAGIVGLAHDRQAYEQALLDVERLRTEQAGAQQNLQQLKEIVIARDLAVHQMDKRIEHLQQALHHRSDGHASADSGPGRR